MFVCNNYQNLKEMLEVAESKKIKKEEEEDQRIRTFWFKRLSQASCIILIMFSFYKEKGRLIIYMHQG
jgi:hypothetical protein